MKIALDMDDVVVDFIGGVLECIATETGIVIPKANIKGWDFGKYGPDDALGEHWFDWLERKDWLWSTFPAVDGAINSITRLRRAGHTVQLISHKPEWAEWCAWRWLGKWRPPVSEVILLDPSETKAHYSDADILVDDKPQNVAEWIETGRQAVTFGQPWNDSTWQWAQVMAYLEETEEWLEYRT